VSVRQATEDDAEAIERVRYETWQATYRGLMPNALLDRMTLNVGARRERLRAQPPDHSCFVAEAGGAVVGFAFGGPERAKDPDYRGEVYAIYVLPAFQGRGLGRALIRECARELGQRGITSLLIWVLRENEIGRRFYERLGGRAVREKPLEGIPGAEGQVEVGYGWADTARLR